MGIALHLLSLLKPASRGWVIVRSDSPAELPVYYAPRTHGPQWSRNASAALRLHREEDAITLAAALAFETRVSRFPRQARR
jgi:hypothetical protein